MVDSSKVSAKGVTLHTHDCTMTTLSEAFLEMSKKPTLAKLAITEHGVELLNQLKALITKQEVNESLDIWYRSGLYIYPR